MRQTIQVQPVGNIDRRTAVVQGKSTGVISRENLMVIGKESDERRIRKIAGGDRYNTTSVGNLPVSSAFRYYTTNDVRKNFFYSGGYLYFIDEAGNTTQLLGIFAPIAIPVFVEFRVSDNNIAYFSEGVSAGMYSHDGNIGNNWRKETDVTLNIVDAVGFLDRMVGFEEDSEDLHISANLAPTNFTDTFDSVIITVGAKRGSKLQRVMVGDDSNLYIFKTDSVWVLQGKTPAEFSVHELNPAMGLAARWSLQKVNNGFMGLMSDYEVYSFVYSQFKLLTYDVALSGDLTIHLLPMLNLDRMININSTYHNFLYRMAFTENGHTYNNMEYCFNTINETEFFTRDFNVQSYLVYDRIPDKKELVIGRSDTGRLMRMYHGLHVDNQAAIPNMPIRTHTKFTGLGKAQNFRVRKQWLNSGVIGCKSIQVKTYLDGRNADSDSTAEEMKTYGEYKNPITAIKISSQDALTSRQIPKRAKSKGQNLAFEINEPNTHNLDFEMMSFEAEIIGKNLKKNEKVGV